MLKKLMAMLTGKKDAVESHAPAPATPDPMAPPPATEPPVPHAPHVHEPGEEHDHSHE